MCMNVSVFFVCPLLWACTPAVSTHARTHAEITRTPLSCGGDECDANSLSLLRQSYKHAYLCTCVCIHIFFFCLFACLSEPDSCLPIALFQLVTRSLDLQYNHLSALPAGIFAGLSSLQWVCVFVVTVYRVLCLSESVECVWVCVRMSVYDSCLT